MKIMSSIEKSSKPGGGSWHFLTNHTHVLLCISIDADITVRDLAMRIGITERAVIRIIGDLDDGGYLTRTREGRRNHYTINPDRPLRHELEAHCSAGDLIAMFQAGLSEVPLEK